MTWFLRTQDKNVAKVETLLYDAGKVVRKGGKTDLIDPIEALRAAMFNTGLSQNEVAELAGMTKQGLSTKFVNQSFKAKDWIRVLDAIGVDVVLVNRKTGDKIRPVLNLKGHGPRVIGNYDRVRYDTDLSECLASSFYADGENEYTDGVAEELFIDSNSRYFMVVYKEGERPKINGVSANVAKAFIQRYGIKGREE